MKIEGCKGILGVWTLFESFGGRRLLCKLVLDFVLCFTVCESSWTLSTDCHPRFLRHSFSLAQS